MYQILTLEKLEPEMATSIQNFYNTCNDFLSTKSQPSDLWRQNAAFEKPQSATEVTFVCFVKTPIGSMTIWFSWGWRELLTLWRRLPPLKSLEDHSIKELNLLPQQVATGRVRMDRVSWEWKRAVMLIDGNNKLCDRGWGAGTMAPPVCRPR